MSALSDSDDDVVKPSSAKLHLKCKSAQQGLSDSDVDMAIPALVDDAHHAKKEQHPKKADLSDSSLEDDCVEQFSASDTECQQRHGPLRGKAGSSGSQSGRQALDWQRSLIAKCRAPCECEQLRQKRTGQVGRSCFHTFMHSLWPTLSCYLEAPVPEDQIQFSTTGSMLHLSVGPWITY